MCLKTFIYCFIMIDVLFVGLYMMHVMVVAIVRKSYTRMI